MIYNKIRHKKTKFRLSIFILLFAGITNLVYAQDDKPDDSKFIKVGGGQVSSVELLSKYLQIPSVSGEEKNAGLFLKSVCEKNNLFVEELGNEEGNYNLSASLFPLADNRPNIILLNHLDVVPAGSLAEWEHKPFEGKIVDGEIWGRGALDMKGVGVAQLSALIRFKNRFDYPDFEYNVTFLAVSAEEVISDYGASFVVENYLERLNPVAVFCEGPIGMDNIISTDKDQVVFGISVADKKPLRLNLQLGYETFAHGASAPEIYAAKDLTIAMSNLLSGKQEIIFNPSNIAMLRGLGELEKGIIGFVMKHPRIFKPLIKYQAKKDPRLFIFFSNTITLVDYRTVSHSANSIPQRLECRLDCRLLPDQDSGEFIQSIRDRLENDNVEIVVEDSLPGTEPSSTSGLLYQKYGEAVMKIYPDAKTVPAIIPGYSDCIHFRKFGIPAYGSNPFYLEQEMLEVFHNFNERIPIAALEDGVKIYFEFINSLLSE